jgi:hypothetical protein
MHSQTHSPSIAAQPDRTLTNWLTSAGSIIARLSPRCRGAILLLALLLILASAIKPLFPSQVTPAGAPAEVFSAERALLHLQVIAKEAHPQGSPAQATVRDYLVAQLTGLGLEVQVQSEWGVENVVARLNGTQPGSGAILLQAHYDSYRGPGAADNGTGVSALLEIMRALAAGPTPRNDVIAFFDDGEELPDPFTGTKVFVNKHPWMDDVRVAIGMDTAVRGPISPDDTGTNNGWLVDVMARAYTGGAWTSLSGGGGYDSQPFRNAGVRVLELEDNYPFHQQHTEQDTLEIVSLGSVQQLGEQALAVVRELSALDLTDTSGEQQTFMYVPIFGLLHYPQAWAPALAILAGLLTLCALALALYRKLASFRGLGVALLALLLTVAVTFAGTKAIWNAAPGVFKWETRGWSEWPEVIPPNGWPILIVTNLLVLVLMVVVYRLARRWSERANFSLLGIIFFLLFSVALALGEPKSAILFTWPVIIGASAWLIAGLRAGKAASGAGGNGWTMDLLVLAAAVPFVLYVVPMVPAVFMSDGTLSTGITAAVWAILLGILLPAVDGLLTSRAHQV